MRWPFSRRDYAPDGAALYAAVVAEMRRPEHYRRAGVPDTMDGRFALLSTLLALADIRLGQGGACAAGPPGVTAASAAGGRKAWLSKRAPQRAK